MTLRGSDMLSRSNKIIIRRTVSNEKHTKPNHKFAILFFILHEHYKAYHMVICLSKLLS